MLLESDCSLPVGTQLLDGVHLLEGKIRDWRDFASRSKLTLNALYLHWEPAYFFFLANSCWWLDFLVAAKPHLRNRLACRAFRLDVLHPPLDPSQLICVCVCMKFSKLVFTQPALKLRTIADRRSR